MSGGVLRAGGILAAGDGSRLRADGWTMAKPLVPVAGVPLVAHVVANFLAAGIESLAIIFNARKRTARSSSASRFSAADIRTPRQDDRLLAREVTARSRGCCRPARPSSRPSTPGARGADFLDFARRAAAAPRGEDRARA